MIDRAVTLLPQPLRHQTQGCSWPRSKDPVHGSAQAVLRVEVGAQIAHLQELFASGTGQHLRVLLRRARQSIPVTLGQQLLGAPAQRP